MVIKIPTVVQFIMLLSFLFLVLAPSQQRASLCWAVGVYVSRVWDFGEVNDADGREDYTTCSQ